MLCHSTCSWSHDRWTDARSGAIMWRPLCCPTSGITVSRIPGCFREALISRETSSHWCMMGITLSQIVVIVTWGASQYLHRVQKKKSQLTHKLPPHQLKQLVLLSSTRVLVLDQVNRSKAWEAGTLQISTPRLLLITVLVSWNLKEIKHFLQGDVWADNTNQRAQHVVDTRWNTRRIQWKIPRLELWTFSLRGCGPPQEP